ncbi:MAG TPA: porin [Trinickia sp.]|uniref:porin n=1 Tax=Trinickia sp. TaxID=2571163 RepID=UPI002CC553BB|nr:porin [Trinickia sp.]HTI16365.1 porin [Trinickia sp.]
MKKSLIAFALTGAAATPAFAQSSVTLYGLIDTGLTYVNNNTNSSGRGVGAVWAMQSGVVQGSRWGLKGSEDLGGGTKVIFQLENGFDVNSGKLGQAGREFGRQAYIGLANDTYGTLTLGRQYDPVADNAQATTFNGQWGALFSHPSDIDNTDNGFRVNNSLKYVSPSFNGLRAEGFYAFGGQAGQFGRDSTIGAGLNYAAGPLYLGAGYFFAKTPREQFSDGNFTTNAPGTPPGVSTTGAFGFVGTPSSMQVISAGGTYSFGPVLVGANWSNARFENAGAGTIESVAGNTATFDTAELWGQYKLTPAATLGLGYSFTWGKVDATDKQPKWGQLNAIADYSLSKRTDVYVMGVYQHAIHTNADIYDGNPGTQSSTRNQVLARIGIRHKF